jgi:hypothetical protein
MADNKKTNASADDDGVDDLKFLSPSTRPDSLGKLGHYEMLQVLGCGGFGIVFRAFDDILHRVVAVKVMAPLLHCIGPQRGSPLVKEQLVDLVPLRGMNLAHLTHLNLRSTNVGDADMAVFKDCKELTDLRLDYTQMGDAGLAHFKGCKNLSGLNLSSAPGP